MFYKYLTIISLFLLVGCTNGPICQKGHQCPINNTHKCSHCIEKSCSCDNGEICPCCETKEKL